MNEKEALEAIAGGADIIDVKNPVEGALGANFPWVIKRIREITPRNIEVSCALGEVPNLPGSISLLHWARHQWVSITLKWGFTDSKHHKDSPVSVTER